MLFSREAFLRVFLFIVSTLVVTAGAGLASENISRPFPAKPETFSNLLEPLLKNNPKILEARERALSALDHVYGSDETRTTRQGLSENPVKFENEKPKMAWWVPKIFFTNAQKFELESTTRTIKPQMLAELINVAVIASPTSISIGSNFELNFFFGRKGVASLTEQHSLKLFNNELIVTRQEVNWLNRSSPLSIGNVHEKPYCKS